MTCIIIDDEPLARDILETLISTNENLTLLATCQNALEGYQALQTQEPELIFLDIQMPQMTGIDFLKSLKNPPLVIFTTAYPNYAVEGFELNAVDYLLKPISKSRFDAAVQKAQIALQHIQSQNALPLAMSAPTLSNNPEDDFFYVKADKKLMRVRFDEILYIEGLKDYVIIKTLSGRIISLQTMKSLEEKLPSDKFFRIHRSFIVALRQIEAIDGSSVFINKQELPIGKNYKEELQEIIEKNRI
jgi:DNA-binding LytR/AlgR family response regulator